jgi:hypothetical protein
MKVADKKNNLPSLSVEIDALLEAGMLELGAFYTIETINPIYHGRLIAVTPSYYVLTESCWIGDTGLRTEYENGTPPAEVNPLHSTEQRPQLIERSAVLTIQKAHPYLQRKLE